MEHNATNIVYHNRTKFMELLVNEFNFIITDTFIHNICDSLRLNMYRLICDFVGVNIIERTDSAMLGHMIINFIHKKDFPMINEILNSNILINNIKLQTLIHIYQ